MTTPAWILDILAAVMLAVAAVSVARLAVARPWRRGAAVALADVDASHLLMAIAMAGMLAASLRTLPNVAWEVIFGVMTAWFAYRVAREARVRRVRALAVGHCAPHAVHAAAMLYMFLALAAPAAGGSGMTGMGGSAMQTLRMPSLAFLFALLLIGYSVADLDQLSGRGAGRHYSFAGARVTPVAAMVASTPALAPGESRAAASPQSAAPEGGVKTATQAHPARPDETASRVGAPVTGNSVLAPSVLATCQIAMGITMAFMLLIMI
jgi:Domain of unknown function (DUF5134)